MTKKSSKKSKEVAVSTRLHEVQQKVAQFLAFSGYNYGTRLKTGAVVLASQKFGVARPTIYTWLQIPEFLDEIEAHKNSAITVAKHALIQAAKRGNVKAIQEIFKRFAPDHEFALKVKQFEHECRMKEIEKRAELGLPVNDEPITYNVTVTEAPMPDKPEGLH